MVQYLATLESSEQLPGSPNTGLPDLFSKSFQNSINSELKLEQLSNIIHAWQLRQTTVTQTKGI